MISITGNYFADATAILTQDIVDMFKDDDLVVTGCSFVPRRKRSDIEDIETLYEIALENVGSQNIVIANKHISLVGENGFEMLIKAIRGMIK